MCDKVYIIYKNGGEWEDSYHNVFKVYNNLEIATQNLNEFNNKLEELRKYNIEVNKHMAECNISNCKKCDGFDYEIEEMSDFIMSVYSIEK